MSNLKEINKTQKSTLKSLNESFQTLGKEIKNLFSIEEKPIDNSNQHKMLKNQWTCSKCTFSANMIECNECEICSNKRKKTTNDLNEENSLVWKCKNCTLINNIKDEKCEVCLLPRDNNNEMNNSIEIINIDAVATKGWMCKKCTFINDLNSDKCEICNSLNNSELKLKLKHNQWICDICSHQNNFKNSSKLTVKCELCGYEPMQTDSIEEISDFERTNSIVLNTSLNDSLNNSLVAYRGQKAKSTILTYTNDEQSAKGIWNNIVSYCKESKIKFVDDSFPPCDKSLFLNPKVKPKSFLNKIINWQSPEYINVPREDKQMKWCVFNKPTFNDIKQGLLGNCWFLSALAVIIEKPEILDNIIITKSYCEQGVYQIRLCHNGEWQTIIIDDLFPCDENNSLIYSRASRKQLWVALIEKAMAKLHGSYEALIAGHTVEGLASLTGYPCESIRLENEKENLNNNEHEEIIWARLLSFKEAGYALGGACGRANISENEFEQKGLFPQHAYSILDIKEIQGHRLLQLRNPWGRFTWNGEWSKNSVLWTPELRLALNKTKNVNYDDQGVFWMSYHDYLTYFSSVDVCKIRKNWMEIRISGYFAPDACRDMQAYHLVVFETSEIDISLFQKSPKNRRESNDSDLSFIVVRYGRPIGRLITFSSRKLRKFINQEHIFEAGEYLIIPLSFNFWYSKDALANNLYNLVLHSSKTFFLEQDLNTPLIMADSLIELCLRNGKITPTTFPNSNIYTLSTDYSGLIIMAENLDPNRYFQIEVDASESSNMVSTRQSLNTYDSIRPLHRQVLIILTHFEASSGYKIYYSLKFKLSSNLFFNYNGKREANYPALSNHVYGLHVQRPL